MTDSHTSDIHAHRPPRTVEELLDRQAERAQAGLQASVLRTGSEFTRSLGIDRFARKHPKLLVGAAAALGALFGPALARTVRNPPGAVRGIGRALAPFGHGVRATAIGAIVAMLRAPRQPQQ